MFIANTKRNKNLIQQNTFYNLSRISAANNEIYNPSSQI
jgi:hypothetical protein